jgi:hypothetical protein
VLEVCVAAGKPVRGGKRGSAMEPLPHVNSVAALGLLRRKLVEVRLLRYASNFSSAYEFTITDAGREALHA